MDSPLPIASFIPNHPRIVRDPNIMGGVPVIKGTRIPVCIILEMLEGGHGLQTILDEYPSLTPEDIQAAIHFAASLTVT